MTITVDSTGFLAPSVDPAMTQKEWLEATFAKFQAKAGMASVINAAGDMTVSATYGATAGGTGVMQVNTVDMSRSSGEFFQGFGTTFHDSYERVIFHESVHAAIGRAGLSFDPDIGDGAPPAGYNGNPFGLDFQEVIAVFAENAIFNRSFGSNSGPAAAERYGHVSPSLDASGAEVDGSSSVGSGLISGVGAFNWLASTDGVKFGVGSNYVSFSSDADDGSAWVEKRYYVPSFFNSQAGIYGLLHLHTAAVTFSSASANVASPVTSTLMSGAMGGRMTEAFRIVSEASALVLPTTASTSQHDLFGVSAEAFRDVGRDASVYTFVGTGYVETQYPSMTQGSHYPAYVPIDVAAQNAGAIVIGAGSATSSDNLTGSAQGDLLIVSGVSAARANIVNAGGGDDVIVGSSTSDTINGGGDADLISGGEGGDTIDGGDGSDTVSYGWSFAPITYGSTPGSVTYSGNMDLLSNIEFVIGTARNDVFNGGGGGPATYLYGQSGDDVFFAGGSDFFFAGSGTDTLNLSHSSSSVLDLTNGVVNNNSFRGIENFVGGAGTDIISGYNAFGDIGVATTIHGAGGNDVIEASAGVSVFGDGNDDRIVVRAGTPASSLMVDGGFGGLDILDFSNLSTSVTFVASVPGSSDGSYGTASYGDSSVAVWNFEGAVGSSAADNLTAMYFGKLWGGGGNDTLHISFGCDAHGGTDYDTMIIDYSGSGATINTASGTIGIDSYSNVFDGIEKIICGNANDTVYVSSGFDVDGAGGPDTLTVLAGVGRGGDGNDTLTASSGAMIYGDANNDTMTAQSGCTAYGGTGTDTLTGFGSSTIYGDADNDVLLAYSGATAHGGAGTDTLYFLGNGAGVTVNMNSVSGTGTAAGVSFDGIERVCGTQSSDYFYGGSGNDGFDGGKGDDFFYGGNGFDTFFANADRVANDGDPDIIGIQKITDASAPGGYHYDVATTYDLGNTYEVDHLYGMEQITFSDGNTFMLGTSSWFSPFYS